MTCLAKQKPYFILYQLEIFRVSKGGSTYSELQSLDFEITGTLIILVKFEPH